MSRSFSRLVRLFVLFDRRVKAGRRNFHRFSIGRKWTRLQCSLFQGSTSDRYVHGVSAYFRFSRRTLSVTQTLQLRRLRGNGPFQRQGAFLRWFAWTPRGVDLLFYRPAFFEQSSPDGFFPWYVRARELFTVCRSI